MTTKQTDREAAVEALAEMYLKHTGIGKMFKDGGNRLAEWKALETIHGLEARGFTIVKKEIRT